MAQRRLLFLDEDVPKRLAGELVGRGYNAVSIYARGLKGKLDPELIEVLAREHGDGVVLVTANESMPVEHAAELTSSRLTVAVIDGVHADVHQDAWKRDTVHRWVHAMEAQKLGTVRRYSPKTHTAWRRRRRQPQMRSRP